MANPEKLEILIIESKESKVNHYFDEISEAFHVTRETGSEMDFNKVKQLEPVLIILDLDVDESGRLSSCKKIKSTPELSKIPIIIATLNHSIEERLRGYEAGAYGYLEFPLDLHYLKNKIDTFVSHQNETIKLSSDAKVATETALSAMVGNSELGQAIRFVEKTYALNDFDALAEEFFNVTNGLNLNCVIYIKSAQGEYYYCSENRLIPLESELLQRMHEEADRFVDINHRTLIFYPRISILIKNMPLNEPERYGRIKDLLPSMMGAADARVVSLDTEDALIRQTDSVASTFDQIRNTLDAVADDYSKNQHQSMMTMTKMLTDLDYHIPGMGLEEDQEEYLLKRISEAVSDATAMQVNGKKLNSSFETISVLLNHLSQQQNAIVELVQSRQEEQADQAPEDDIEFF